MPTEEPFFASASLGYRGWRLDGGILRPCHRDLDGRWQPVVTIARCDRGSLGPRHNAPDADCSCGLHAYHDLGRLSAAMRMQERMEEQGHRGFCEIVGAVAARGNVRIHHDGWRAEEAQVLGLLVIGIDDAPAWRLTASANAGELYGVPLFTTAEDLDAHAEHLAEPIPANCRPPKPAEPDPEEQARLAIERSRRVAEIRAANAPSADVAWRHGRTSISD